MRHCPVCDARYEDETIKFCTKDGSPLVEGEKPNFVILPSENLGSPEDTGEETVIRRKSDPNFAPPVFEREQERIVVPTADPTKPRLRPRQVYYPPPEPQNTAKVIALTIVGTLVVLSFGAGLFWLFQSPPANINVNTSPINLNSNLNANLGFVSNFNFNSTPANYASNYNFNFNFNAQAKTPTNTPTPRNTPISSPTPLLTSPSPSPKPAETTKPAASPPRMAPRTPAAANRPAGNGN